MNALLWLVGILLGIYLFLFFFGRIIGQFLLRRLAKMASEQMKKQSQEYEEAYRSTQFEKKIKTSADQEVVIPHQVKKKEPKSTFGENVEFEEDSIE